MIFEFFYMGKHTIFVYVAYMFSIVVLFIGYYYPHYVLKKEIKQRNDQDNSEEQK